MSKTPRTPIVSPDLQHPETRQRFAQLRSLIYDERRRHRLVLLGALIALVLVAGLTLLARLYTVLPFDVWFTQELQEHQWSLVTRLMVAVSAIGYTPWSAITIVAGTVLVGVLLGWRDGLYLLVITGVQGLVNALIKTAIGRPRPIDSLVDVFVPVHGFSFPSGHVMFYTVFFGFLLFLTVTRLPQSWLRWVIAVPLAALVLLVGSSRIILGAHWLSDVLAAYLLGLVLLVVAIEGYIHFLVPPTPAAERGVMRHVDEQREAQSFVSK